MLFFEWNQKKAIVNFKKHDVTFEEASTFFCDALSTTFPDPEHSIMESRYIYTDLSKLPI